MFDRSLISFPSGRSPYLDIATDPHPRIAPWCKPVAMANRCKFTMSARREKEDEQSSTSQLSEQLHGPWLFGLWFWAAIAYKLSLDIPVHNRDSVAHRSLSPTQRANDTLFFLFFVCPNDTLFDTLLNRPIWRGWRAGDHGIGGLAIKPTARRLGP